MTVRQSRRDSFRMKENILLQFSLHNDLVFPHVGHLIQALVDLTGGGKTESCQVTVVQSTV